MKNNFLLSERFKPAGIILLLLGFLLIEMRYQFNYKPDLLNMKVFAFYTYYIESKSFTVVSNQMLEEFGAIFILLGLAMLSFAKEKVENEATDSIRLKAFILASYFNLAFLLISLLFFFGFGFVGALTVFMGVWLLSYLVIFKSLICRHNKVS